jgi:hypothetical protein
LSLPIRDEILISISVGMANYCNKILALDPKIRFTDKIMGGGDLVSPARKDGVVSLLDRIFCII